MSASLFPSLDLGTVFPCGVSVYLSDGTTNAQNAPAPIVWYDQNLGYPVEPTVNPIGGFDVRSRALVFAVREGGTGSWSCDFQFQRDPGGSYETPPKLAGINVRNRSPSEPLYTLIEDPFPPDFLQGDGTNINDVLRFRPRLTPGSATQIPCCFIFMLGINKTASVVVPPRGQRYGGI